MNRHWQIRRTHRFAIDRTRSIKVILSHNIPTPLMITRCPYYDTILPIHKPVGKIKVRQIQFLQIKPF
jgi:hypothetical protein